MKLITNPFVFVLAVPKFFDHPQYDLPEGGTDSERLIAHGGKGCYDSYGKDGRSIPEHIGGIIDSRHGSVLEHASVSLFFSGISRGCSHEIVRHRAGFAYSQRSTRYTSEEGGCFVLEPGYAQIQDIPFEDRTPDEHKLMDGFEDVCGVAMAKYSEAVQLWMNRAPLNKTGTERRKWARGKARQLLPHALETRMTITGNLRAWRFWLEERSGRGAEPEIRRLAAAVMDVLEPIAPLVFKDMLTEVEWFEGYPIFHPEVPKV